MQLNAKLIEVVEKPYSMNGNEGISYRLRFLTEKDEIMAFKSDKNQCALLKPLVQKSGKLTLVASTYKEEVSVKVASFEAK